MANCFVFMDKSPVADNGSLAWTNQVTVSASLDVSINGDCSMTDSINDSYATAMDENETQYLSVLETTNDVTLEDIHNLTIGNPKLMGQENLPSEPDNIPDVGDENLADTGDQQVVIFNMEGSDDLYGIQFAQDEEGNIQKYQFQVRTNGDGQFEAIPETIQLLPEEQNTIDDLQEDTSKQTHESADDNDKTLEEVVFETQVYLEEESNENTSSEIYLQNAENVIEEIQTENENQTDEGSETVFVFIKSEPTRNQEQDETVLEDDHGNDESDDKNGAIDIKPCLMEESLDTNVKQEYNVQNQRAEEEEHQAEEIIYESSELPEENSQEILLQDYHTEVCPDEETILHYQPFDTHNADEICDDTAAAPEPSEQIQEHEEHQHHAGLFIDEEDSSHKENLEHEGLELDSAVGEQFLSENDSDSEGYEMGDGLHVTAEGDISEAPSSPEYQTVKTIYQEEEQFEQEQTTALKKQMICSTTNVLKQPMNTNNMDNFSNKTILYYMITNPEQKENVISMPMNNSLLSIKPNPRSLLKSVAETVGEINYHHSDHASNGSLRIKEKSKDPKKSPSQRRFARSSEFIQAKLFNNFINKTTISQAPVRQIRLPRKQEIKPVDTRQDEEIIVKEVMVSSKGFVENVNDRLNSKEKLEVTSIVELTDSDEEQDPRTGTKKKKKHRKSLQYLTIGDGDATVIEILQSDEEAETRPANAEVAKRGRGRPRKSVAGDASKRPRGRPPKEAAPSPRKKSRTESSEPESDQGKTEISCPHCPKSFPSQNSLSTHIQHHNLENSLRNAKTQPIEYKHKCDTCQETFKNSILLKRHTCQKRTFKCTICSKTFNDMAPLNAHKRIHQKENLVKNTSTVTVSPKKFKPRPSAVHKSPKKVAASKCRHCPKVCSGQAALTAHERTHKSFSCATCKSGFSSKLLLDTHLRISCVKTASPKDKRLSFKIRKSFMSSPRRSRAAVPSRSRSRLSVTRTRTSTVPSRTLEIPSRTSGIPGRISRVPNRTSVVANRTAVAPANLLTVPSGGPEKPSKTSGVYSKPLDMNLQCSSCSMKFSTMTALFKHEVREHNVHTPDKRVLLPDKKLIHKPLHEHGGIPMPCRLNKVFQGFRKKLESDSTADVTVADNSDEK